MKELILGIKVLLTETYAKQDEVIIRNKGSFQWKLEEVVNDQRNQLDTKSDWEKLVYGTHLHKIYEADENDNGTDKNDVEIYKIYVEDYGVV